MRLDAKRLISGHGFFRILGSAQRVLPPSSVWTLSFTTSLCNAVGIIGDTITLLVFPGKYRHRPVSTVIIFHFLFF